MKVREIPNLMEEVVKLKTVQQMGEVRKPEQFINILDKKLDEDGDQDFPTVVRLGKALLTIYNSSSAAERFFTAELFCWIR